MSRNTFTGGGGSAAVPTASPPRSFLILKPATLLLLPLAAASVTLSLHSPLASPAREVAALFELQGGDHWHPQASAAPVWLTRVRAADAPPCLPLPFQARGSTPLLPLRGG